MATEIQELKRQNDRNHAKRLLERVLKQVEPLMKRHSLRLTKLSEFYPKTPNLLGVNVNRGHEIKLRLRHPTDTSSFLEYESILGTMLHELVHNSTESKSFSGCFQLTLAHSNHGKEFYKLLDEYTDEMENIMAKGYVIEQNLWTGIGQKLSNARPIEERRSVIYERSKIASAAEKRKKIFTGGVYKLSSDSSTSASGSSRGGRENARKMAVEAAEKRRREADEKWCGSADNSVQNKKHNIDDEDELEKDDDDIEIVREIIVLLDD